ncbi:MAG: 5-deoxy-glucuronate isomerase [Ornithinibacter sp.]
MSLGRDNATWCHLAGTRAEGEWDCVIDERLDGWAHTGLRTATLAPGASLDLALTDDEAVVVPLSGGLGVEVFDGDRVEVFELAGRPDVFAGPTDVLHVPIGCSLRLVGSGAVTARVAVCLARVEAPSGRRPVHLAAEDVPVELRGAGTASREVRNFGVPGVLDAQRIIACEVITPAGNWSSWPPHKHDEERAGVESELEEIYWFQTRSTDEHGSDAVGYQRVYGTDARPIDILAEVRTGDVVLVPHGWHGPAMAAPDADLYYLNVMAGPGPERAWRICDDPAHAAVRGTWADQPIDPRLPLRGRTT